MRLTTTSQLYKSAEVFPVFFHEEKSRKVMKRDRKSFSKA